MNYGTDLKLDDRDVSFLSSGDLETISGGALIAQDIAEEASIPLGSVPWDREAGSTMYQFLNDPNVDEDDVIQELERLALKDTRVDASTVKAVWTADGRFSLKFTPLNTVSEETLLFDLADMLGGSDE